MIAQEELRPVIGGNVERLRKAKGMSQEELAEAVGISRVFLNRIENGKSSPGAEVLYGLADVLKVTADNLRQLPS
ncbi:MAG TPA: helix-turn-helix transcriptional regulator [Pirellulaceae bacterium]|nr:helix-turn-helix transcriptional regulator [Pirellulaceae bacterium]